MFKSKEISYSQSKKQVTWVGYKCKDTGEFDSYLKDTVKCRLYDDEITKPFESELKALATTNMGSEIITEILALECCKEDWEIGESLAECLVMDSHKIELPWNSERDKKTPKASLPGADIIGFIKAPSSEEYYLAIGEVKTSWDVNVPPGVVYGRSGMIHQIDNLVHSLAIQTQILKWLRVRCINTEFWQIYQSAVSNYINSKGKAIFLFGVLIRDTSPDELDLKNRAISLADKIHTPMSLDLIAWYLPRKISEWAQIIE